MQPDPHADYDATSKLIDWAFSHKAALQPLRDDPVWAWYHAIRAPKIKRLRVVFDASNAGAVCAPCGKCCSVDARFVVHTYDVLAWALLGQKKVTPLPPVETSCLFLATGGCVIEREARPTLCSTFTCSPLNTELDTFAVNEVRTPLWGYTQAAARYLARSYVLESKTHRASVGLSAADLHGLFDAGEVTLRHVGEATEAREPITGIKRHDGKRLELSDDGPAPPAPDPTQDPPSFLSAERLRRARAHQRAEILLTRSLPEIDAPERFADILREARAAHAELGAAQRDYARRFCRSCPEAAPHPPLPGEANYELHRQATFTRAAMQGRYQPTCMYHHCASAAHLDELDVAAWRALSTQALPVLQKPTIGRCSLLGPVGCTIETEARSPSCDRFACHRLPELPDAAPLAVRVQRAHQRSTALFELIRAAYAAHQSNVEYPAAPRRGEPLFG